MAKNEVNPKHQANARRAGNTVKPLCANRPFSELVTNRKHEFTYCGFPLQRNAYLFRVECRPIIKFNREGLGHLKAAISPRMTHEIWATYKRRQNNAPIRLLFRHQYGFGVELFEQIDSAIPIQLRHGRYSEAFSEISRAAGYVTRALANTIDSITGQKSFYLQRRALFELLPERELEPQDYQRIADLLSAEHRQLDYFWAKQAEHAYERYCFPEREMFGVSVK